MTLIAAAVADRGRIAFATPQPERSRMSSYAARRLSNSTILPAADGVAHCRTGDGFLHWHGGITTSLLSNLYIAPESNPTAITDLGPLPMPGRHTHVLVPLEDRVYSVGGDSFGGVKQPQIYSWKTDGSDFRLELDNVPGLDGALHFAFEMAGWIVWGGGQRFMVQGHVPAPILTLYRWRPGQAVEQIFAKAPYGARGVYSTIAKHKGKAILPGGAIYEDIPAGLPRLHQNDFVSIDSDFKVETIQPRSVIADRIWMNLVSYDELLWHLFGHKISQGLGSLGDVADIRVSADDGETFTPAIIAPDPQYGMPVARHASATIVIPAGAFEGINIATGSHVFHDAANAHDMWLIHRDPYNYGAPQVGTSAWDAGYYSICDGSIIIPPGTTINTIGIKFNGEHPGTIYRIVRHHPNDTFDFLWSSDPFTHHGLGFNDRGCGYTAPDDGAVYRLLTAAIVPGQQPFHNTTAHKRWQLAGTPTANGTALGMQSDGTICMRWS